MKFKHIFILFLSVLLAVILVSCEFATPNQSTDTSDTVSSLSPDQTNPNDDQGSVEESSELVLYEDGKFNFSLTRSGDITDISVYSAFLSRLKQVTSINKINLDTDDTYRGHEYDPEKKEILFGFTKYPESEIGAEDLGFYEYRVSRVGNKIVISVKNEADLTNAAALFIDYIRKNEKDGRVVIPSDPALAWAPPRCIPELASESPTHIPQEPSR